MIKELSADCQVIRSISGGRLFYSSSLLCGIAAFAGLAGRSAYGFWKSAKGAYDRAESFNTISEANETKRLSNLEELKSGSTHTQLVTDAAIYLTLTVANAIFLWTAIDFNKLMLSIE